MIPLEIKKDFVELRIQSEVSARRIGETKAEEEVSFFDIYSVMNQTLSLAEADLETLMELEFQLEKENVIGIKKVVDEISLHLVDGDKVILISDT